MTKGRIEAFTDAVIAIIMTIMVLELRPPHGFRLADLAPLLPTIGGYILSFIFLGIYWNNHHHMFQSVKRVGGPVLWANNHLLFWLSLIPFGTSWMAESHYSSIPVAVYGVLLLMCGVAYTILTLKLVKVHGKQSELAEALGSDLKGKLSVLFYAIAVAVAWWFPYVSCGLYITVAFMWFIPDRRFEKSHSND